MKKKEEKEVVFLKEYCIEGTARFDGDEEYISQPVKAFSPDQAFLRLAKRLEIQRKQLINLCHCRIYTIKVFLPKRMPIKHIKKKEKRGEQLVLHFF